jgi:hypothetical protein
VSAVANIDGSNLSAISLSDAMNSEADDSCNAGCTTEKFPSLSSFDVILRCALPSESPSPGVKPPPQLSPSAPVVPGLEELLASRERAADIMRSRIHRALTPSATNSSIRSSLPAFAVAWSYTVANRTASPALLANISSAAYAAASRSSLGSNSISGIDPDMSRFLNTSSFIEGLGVEIDSMMSFTFAASAPLAPPAEAKESKDWIAAPVVLGFVALALLFCFFLIFLRRRKNKRAVKPSSDDGHSTSIPVRSK